MGIITGAANMSWHRFPAQEPGSQYTTMPRSTDCRRVRKTYTLDTQRSQTCRIAVCRCTAQWASEHLLACAAAQSKHGACDESRATAAVTAACLLYGARAVIRNSRLPQACALRLQHTAVFQQAYRLLMALQARAEAGSMANDISAAVPGTTGNTTIRATVAIGRGRKDS